ncbi:ECF RNA polymerase sigma factor SigE [Kordia antarctica]|uniref:ECF RNA polymerase sigma factor SigE n=1 Tax=Kordia antarctica TaxID=1218801 RepID=A0A7L4ZLM7_9FLAO|nr:sigma-70 family RNA polymerase sigma factor [Kordia antarctica]QHI37339.1 ECF RNA polymerase sigma factor SigE [Kordia antarctica]
MQSEHDNLCDEDYFTKFYATYLQAASNFAFYKSGDKATSMDIIQEAFVKIWENCAKIDTSKAKTYLFTTINNTFLNIVKHQKVVLTYEQGSSYMDRTNQDPEYIMQENEFKKKLQAAIAGLEDKEREVFLLNRIEGKKYREIAELLDISQKTVEKRMSLALKYLRTKIEGL